MPRCIDEIQLVFVSIVRPISKRNTLGFNRDPPLPFELHRIENLLRHFTAIQAPAFLDQSVSQRRLPMVDVGDDREVANGFLVATSHKRGR